MKSLLIATALFVSTLSVPVMAAVPPMPDSTCQYTTSQSIRCTDRFGNNYTCVLRELIFITRWIC